MSSGVEMSRRGEGGFGRFNSTIFLTAYFSTEQDRRAVQNAIERPLRYYSIERGRNKVEELENCSTSVQWGAGRP